MKTINILKKAQFYFHVEKKTFRRKEYLTKLYPKPFLNTVIKYLCVTICRIRLK